MALKKEEIIKGFINAGLGESDIVLVHSSLSSFGYVEGGAITVINALIDTVGPNGTVVVPTLTGKNTDDKNNPPIFDVRFTPCWTGKISETVRQMKGARRSLHPTHSVAAVGARRDGLVEGHEKGQSPCDKSSPYYKNAISGGYIMLIGVDQESNTSIHCCEEIAGVPYHLQKEMSDIYITDYSGNSILVKNYLHNWYKPATDFNKLDGLFKSNGIMKVVKIGYSTVRLINAKQMLEFTVDLLKRNPVFLIK